MPQRRSQTRILTRHFVQRFVDNDLLSAHVDRHESLSFFGATLIALGAFGAALLGMKYMGFAPSVSWIAVAAMEDRFTMIAVSMIAVALTTAAQWEALSLDSRDGAILGPLPISHGTLLRAKVGANLVFAALIVAAVTVAPSILYSSFSLAPVRPPLKDGVRVIAAHLTSTAAAAIFAFVAVVTAREFLRLVTGARIFGRISTSVQLLLVMTLAILLLALPIFPGVTRTWLGTTSGGGVTPFAVPVMWFVGLAETLIGTVIVLAPVGGIVMDDDLSRLYLRHRELFRELGLTGLAALAGTVTVGASMYLWNERRLPEPMPRPQRQRGWLPRLLAAAAARVLVRKPLAQAGFFFTLRVLRGSPPHRFTMALGLAMAAALFIVFTTAATPSNAAGRATPLWVWTLQPLILLVLLAAFRHAAALPADLRAAWVFVGCWPARWTEFLAGIERAALIVVAMPAIMALLPFHLAAFGPRIAIFHAASGVLLAMALLAAVTWSYQAPPFVSSYTRRPLSTSPIVVLTLVGVAFLVAELERKAAATVGGMVVHTLVLLALPPVIRVIAARRGQRLPPPEEEGPTSQTLGLGG